MLLLLALLASPPAPRTVLVLDLKPVGVPVEEAQALLAAVLADTATRADLRPLSRQDVLELSQHVADLQALGCDDVACAAQLVELTGAGLVLSGSLGRIEHEIIFSLTLVDAARAVTLGSASRTAASYELARAAVPDMVNELFGGGAASAAAYHLPGGPVSFAVLDLKAVGVPVATAENLTQILATEIKRIDQATVVSRDDIVAMVTLEAEKGKLGCTDDVSCLAEIGGALGVSGIVVGHVGRVGDSLVISLRLIDPKQVVVQGRVSESFKGPDDQLLLAVRHAARRLFGLDSQSPGVLAVSTNQAGAVLLVDNRELGPLPQAPTAGLAAGVHAVRVSKDDYVTYAADVYVEPGATTALWVELSEVPHAWYERWWVWGAAAVVAGGVTTAIIVTRSNRGALVVRGTVPGTAP